MPIDYKIIPDQKLVIARGTGVVVAGEILEHFDILAADKDYIPPMKKLVDYRDAISLHLSADDAWNIAHRRKELAEFLRGERCAFVSPGDATFAATRVHESLVNVVDVNTAVFRTIEEAADWLGVKL